MMDCNETKDLLVDLVFAELDEERAVLVHQHLASCERCRAEERRLLLLREGLRGTLAEPGPELQGRIGLAWPGARRLRGGGRWMGAGLLRRAVPAYLAAAACVGAVLVALLAARLLPDLGLFSGSRRPAATVTDPAPPMFVSAGSYDTGVAMEPMSSLPECPPQPSQDAEPRVRVTNAMKPPNIDLE